MSSRQTGASAMDADAYHEISGPQESWSRRVLDRLELAGDETVLDAGCGSGRVTRLLAERVPDGRIIAVDLSQDMVRLARRELGSRAVVRRADLTTMRLPADEIVDAVFSNAVFQLIADHGALFEALHRSMVPGGRLVAECGGDGNLDDLGEAISAAAAESGMTKRVPTWPAARNYATAEETAARLVSAGFEQVRCWLEPMSITPQDPQRYLETVYLAPYLACLGALEREVFVDRLLARLGTRPLLKYVRLNIDATRAGQ